MRKKCSLGNGISPRAHAQCTTLADIELWIRSDAVWLATTCLAHTHVTNGRGAMVLRARSRRAQLQRKHGWPLPTSSSYHSPSAAPMGRGDGERPLEGGGRHGTSRSKRAQAMPHRPNAPRNPGQACAMRLFRGAKSRTAGNVRPQTAWHAWLSRTIAASTSSISLWDPAASMDQASKQRASEKKLGRRCGASALT